MISSNYITVLPTEENEPVTETVTQTNPDVTETLASLDHKLDELTSEINNYLVDNDTPPHVRKAIIVAMLEAQVNHYRFL